MKTVFLMICMLMAASAFAEDNILSWDPTTDPRVEATQIDRCVGSTIECASQNATWTQVGQVPMPDTSFTDAGATEGRTYNYTAYFWNQDQGRGPGSNVASKRVPFGAAPADTPNLSVQ